MSTKTNNSIERVAHTQVEPRNSLGLVGIQKIQINEKYIELVM